jgi:hypothetical protein
VYVFDVVVCRVGRCVQELAGQLMSTIRSGGTVDTHQLLGGLDTADHVIVRTPPLPPHLGRPACLWPLTVPQVAAAAARDSQSR